MASAAMPTKASVTSRTLPRFVEVDEDFRCMRFVSYLIAENDLGGLDALGIGEAKEIGAAANPLEHNDFCQRSIRGWIEGHGGAADGRALKQGKIHRNTAFEEDPGIAGAAIGIVQRLAVRVPPIFEEVA